MTKYGALDASPSFYNKRGDIYKLILSFSISRSAECTRSHSKCARSHLTMLLQFWWAQVRLIALYVYLSALTSELTLSCDNDFVDLWVRFPVTPSSLQSEFYNSRYGLFGGTRQVRITTWLKFAANAPRTVLSPTIYGISPRYTLTTCKILKHQN